MSYGIIYLAINKMNGKVYIGQTTMKLKTRITCHLNAAKRGKNNHFHNALLKYGRDGFDFSVLCECKNAEDLNQKEAFWVEQYGGFQSNQNYNSRTGGGRGTLSAESRLKIANTLRGRYVGEKNPFFGQHHTEDTKRAKGELLKVKYLGEGNPFFGKSHTEQTRALNSKNRKGKCAGENNPWFGVPMTDDRKVKIRIGLNNWLKTDEAKEYLKNRFKGDKNHLFISITDEQKLFIINLRVQGASYHSIWDIFAKKFASPVVESTQLFKRVCKENNIPAPVIPIQKRHLYKLQS